jgi:hypothetical protein
MDPHSTARELGEAIKEGQRIRVQAAETKLTTRLRNSASVNQCLSSKSRDSSPSV